MYLLDHTSARIQGGFQHKGAVGHSLELSAPPGITPAPPPFAIARGRLSIVPNLTRLRVCCQGSPQFASQVCFVLLLPQGRCLSWDEMQTSTPLAQLSFGEDPWTSDRDLSLQEEEEEDSPPERWFDYFPVCGTPVYENSQRQGHAPLTTHP